MSNHLRLALILTVLSSAIPAQQLAAQGAAAVTYPATRRADQVDTYHGVQVADPYRWLEDDNAVETRQWIDAQNTLTSSFLSRIPVRDSLRERLTKLWNYPKYGVPVRAANRFFYLENSGLQNQPVLYVKSGINGNPAVLIDPNTLSANGTASLSVFEPSPNSNYLAYAVSAAGSDWQEVRVRDVRRGTDLADTLKWVKFSGISWTRDNAGFFYSRYDAPRGGAEFTGVVKNQKLYFHRVGTSQSADVLILERPDDPDLGFDAIVSKDGEFVIIAIWRGTDPRNLVSVIDLAGRGASRVTAPVVRLIDKFIGAFTYVHSDTSRFYFLTDHTAPRGRIVSIDVNEPQEENWITVIRETPNTMQQAVSAGGSLVINFLKDARSALTIYSLRGGSIRDVPLPGLGTVGEIWGAPDQMEFFYSFTSFLAPPSVHRFLLTNERLEVYREPKLDFPFDEYETTQIFTRINESTRIPIFVTARRGLVLDGSHPTLLFGYGGFNVSVTPDFSPAILAWLERGGIYASVNTRGGGEYGREWHEAGTLLQKQNVFDDFVAAAELLISRRYTSSAHLAILGGSNGGLLVGAIMTQRPELAAVAMPAVGVMDMLRFQKFTIGWAWTSDYGSSDNAEQFKALFAYSPLHNLKPGTRYPATLITTADHDDRVVPAHSFKFAAALQAAQGGPAPALIRIETEAGHGAGKPTDKKIAEWADRLAFAWAYTR